MENRSVEHVFARAWHLLRANRIIVVPGVVLGFVSAIATALVTSSAAASTNATTASSTVFAALFQALVVTAIQLLATLVAVTYTTGMAAAAWRDGTTRLVDGRLAFRREAGHVLGALVGLYLIGLAATFLAPWTAFLSLLAYMYFFIYTMAAAVVGEHSGYAAIRESARIAIARPRQTLLLVGGVFFVAVISALVASVLRIAPFVGPILAWMLFEAVVAYVVLVVVGEYVALRTPAGVTRLPFDR